MFAKQPKTTQTLAQATDRRENEEYLPDTGTCEHAGGCRLGKSKPVLCYKGTTNSLWDFHVFISWTSKTEEQFWRTGISAKLKAECFKAWEGYLDLLKLCTTSTLACELVIPEHRGTSCIISYNFMGNPSNASAI